MTSIDPIRIGICGTGYIARRAHLPNFQAMSGVKITALYNRTRLKAQDCNEEFCDGKAEVFDDWQDLVRADIVDAVSICTTADQHAPVAIAALEVLVQQRDCTFWWKSRSPHPWKTPIAWSPLRTPQALSVWWITVCALR